ncbi:hypothetical protein IscW_ISCW013181 [Ixodes scapularis]|uniref:C2H2-type domain-containing protein n=1 Tax=Ixodes scapularis TaxID=6945 RepID=B7Q9Z9_IXOSC|nr:hypothetical protein IscW_ISCW013181 [Ixodes scapularis]|eukprot:XP_002399660.1 hypothetical protein IscW_ISCW013181 [Ixodes scapularis]
MYSCHVCKLRQKNLYHYERHYRLHSTSHNLSLPCLKEWCSRSFRSFNALRVHTSKCHSGQKSHHDGREYVCPHAFCSQKVWSRLEMTKHIKGHISSGLKTSCFMENCRRQFQNSNTFSAHMSRCHSHQAKPPSSYSQHDYDSDGAQPRTDMENSESLSFAHSAEQANTSCEGPGEASLETTHLALFFMKLEAMHLVPASVVQSIANEMYFLDSVAKDSKVSGICRVVECFDVSAEVCHAVVAELKAEQSPLCPDSGVLRSMHSRSQFYKNNFAVIDPVEVKCAHARSFHYVPVKETLEAFLSDISVQKLLSRTNDLEPGFLQDITDGKLYGESNFFIAGENTIQLLLFQDAFEVANPLGSARKKHKILGMYYTIANMPPFAQTKVHAMQLVMLCYDSTLQKVGHDVVMKSLVSDLADLEKDGVTVNGVRYNCGLLSCLGDNLGSHGIGGFVESFSRSKYFCRFCEVTRDAFMADFRSMGPRRTAESYEKCLKRIKEEGLDSCLGVKFDSSLNSLLSFHATSGLPPCIAHDLYEGVVPYDLSLILRRLAIEKKWFSIEELNSRIANMKLKGHDSKNRPCKVSCEGNCRGEAVETFYLVRFLPVLLFDKVRDVQDEAWQLYLILKDIVTLLASSQLHLLDFSPLHIYACGTRNVVSLKHDVEYTPYL